MCALKVHINQQNYNESLHSESGHFEACGRLLALVIQRWPPLPVFFCKQGTSLQSLIKTEKTHFVSHGTVKLQHLPITFDYRGSFYDWIIIWSLSCVCTGQMQR